MSQNRQSDKELLTVLLTDGRNEEQACELASALLAQYGTLAAVLREDTAQLRMTVGLIRARRLAAAGELAQRIITAESSAPLVIRTAKDVENFLRPRVANLPHEELWVLYLSASNTVLESARMSSGGVSATIIDHRLVVKRAIELLASSIILVHNHPSDITTPSVEDIAQTTRLAEAAALFDIRLTDHLILAPTAPTFSFRKNKIGIRA